jgi:dCMP deaminase
MSANIDFSEVGRSKDEVFMRIAYQLGVLSTCPRANVGALIVRDGRCISWGYNGAPPGLPHCTHSLSEPCDTATHAEANAIAFAARQGISTDAATMFVTMSPCAACARLLIAAGIEKVVMHSLYRDRSGIDVLQEALVGTSILTFVSA